MFYSLLCFPFTKKRKNQEQKLKYFFSQISFLYLIHSEFFFFLQWISLHCPYYNATKYRNGKQIVFTKLFLSFHKLTLLFYLLSCAMKMLFINNTESWSGVSMTFLNENWGPRGMFVWVCVFSREQIQNINKQPQRNLKKYGILDMEMLYADFLMLLQMQRSTSTIHIKLVVTFRLSTRPRPLPSQLQRFFFKDNLSCTTTK